MIPSVLLLVAALAHAGPTYPAPNVKVGDPALLFTLPALNEEVALRTVARPQVALSDFTGVLPGFPAKAVVVHFFERAGSEAQIASLGRLQRRYGGAGLQVIGVVVDGGDIAELSEWIQAQRPEFPVLRDAHRIVAGRYGVAAFPMSVVVEASGDIVAIGVPGADIEQSLEAVTAPYLRK